MSSLVIAKFDTGDSVMRTAIPNTRSIVSLILNLTLFLIACASAFGDEMESIRVSENGKGFVLADSGKPFRIWGVNYDHDAGSRLLEDYWEGEWPTVVEDFKEIKALGANVVRIHLQIAKFMKSKDDVDPDAILQLGRLLKLAEETGLYLDITGLGCYHKQDLPAWYDKLHESDRWAVQARFWEAVAEACARSPAVFCYDLMNEPILPGAKKVETDWLTGELGGKHFVQRISLDLKGRSRQDVAKAWIEQLVMAIRKKDQRHLITVGVIPWAHTWPNAKPLFHDSEVGAKLDFVSVHFYPRKGELDKALTALSVYELGKPLVIEEMFPLKCGQEELDQFIDRSRRTVDGYIGFYWGKTIEDYDRAKLDLAGAITKQWLQYFQNKAPEMKSPNSP